MSLPIDTIAALLLAGAIQAPDHAGPRMGCGMSPWSGGATRGIGMVGNGWDGEGQNATTIYFHIEIPHPLQSAQREQFLDMLQAWANEVQIHFVELPIANATRSIDLLWVEGNHCDLDSAECGQPGCDFSDMPSSFLGHAAYPPGIETICGGVSQESRAGDIHLNLDATIQSNPDNAGYSFKLVAAHMIGHALGLQDNPNPGDHNVMGPIEWNENFLLISESDSLQLQAGYAAGVGSVTTLESLGIWVNSAWTGSERGTPGSPFDTLHEGVAGLPAHHEGVTIHVQAGLYPGPITITEPCTIMSEFGTAFIGQ